MEHDNPSDAPAPCIASPSTDAPIAAAAPTVTGTPPAGDAPTAAPPTQDAEEPAPAQEAPEPAPWKALAIGGAVAGLVVAIAGELEQRDALTAELDQLADAYEAAMAAPSPPRLPPPQPAASSQPGWWNPVTSKPKHVNFDWCFRFLWQTMPDKRAKIVPSRASRSQYLRIGKLIPEDWGRALDKRRTTFEALRWIAAPQTFEGRQARYMRVLRGEPRDEQPSKRPAELQASWKTPPLPKHLLRAPKRIEVAGATEACDPGPLVECRSPPPPPRCHRPGRRRWEPRRPAVCGEALPSDSALVDAVEAALQKTMGPDFRLPREASGVPTPDSTGSCLPRLAPCPRRRRRRAAPATDSSPQRPRGRRRLPGDIDWW
jgi:hypothetical protein